MLAPYAEQRYTMVDLCGLPQPSAGFPAAPPLQPSEDAHVVAWPGPKIPRNNASRVPEGVLVRSAIPQICVPAEPIDRLTADATKARPTRVALLAIGRWRDPETRYPLPALARLRQTGQGLATVRLAPHCAGRLFVGEPPRPSRWSAATSRKRACEAVCPQRMGAPIRINRKPRQRRRQTPCQRVNERRPRKHRRQGHSEPREGLPVDLVTPF